MKKIDFIKGNLIKPIVEILKKDFDIKSPTPLNLMVSCEDEVYTVIYKSNKQTIDFTSNQSIQDLIIEIKNKPFYEKL